MQRQPRELLTVVLHLVFAAGVKLPGDAVERGAGQAQSTSGEHHVTGVFGGKGERRQEAHGPCQNGGFVQAVSHGHPAGRFISDARGFDYDVAVLRLQSLLQLVLELVLCILAVVDLVDDVTLCGRHHSPEERDRS